LSGETNRTYLLESWQSLTISNFTIAIASDTDFMPLPNTGNTPNATEAVRQIPQSINGVLTQSTIVIDGNDTENFVLITCRFNSVDNAHIMTVTASVNGVFSSTQPVSFLAGDLASYRVDFDKVDDTGDFVVRGNSIGGHG